MQIQLLQNIQKITPLKQRLTTKPSFKGTDDAFIPSEKLPTDYEKFETWAKKANLGETIKSTILNQENILGNGFSNTVYQIPENDEYVLRVGTSSKKEIEELVEKSEMEIVNKENTNLKGNYGQKIAEIKFKDSYATIEVLKKQEGKTYGVPPTTVIYEENGNLRAGEVAYEDISRKEQYEKSLASIAKYPVSSYEKLIEDVLRAQRAGFAFDFENANNFMYDDKTQSINMIDLIQRGTPFKNELGNILWSLVCTDFAGTYFGSDEAEISKERKQKTLMNNLEVIEKFTLAMKNKGVKFDYMNERLHRLVSAMPMMAWARSFDREVIWGKLEHLGILDREKLY